MDTSFAVSVAVFSLLFVFLVIGLGWLTAYISRSEKLKSRLENQTQGSSVKDDLDLFQAQRQQYLEKKLQQYLTQLKTESWMRLMLYRTGLDISLTQLAMIELILMCAFFMIGLLYLDQNILVIFLESVLGAPLLTAIVFKLMIDNRQSKFLLFFPNGMDIILRGLKAGFPIMKTLQTVAEEIPDPVGAEFRKMITQVEVGVPFERALEESGMRVGIKDYSLFCVALIIQNQTGGSLSEVVESILYILNRSAEIRMKARVLSAETRLTGWILGGLPLVVFAGVSYIQKNYMDFFMNNPDGKPLLITAVSLIILNALIIRTFVNIKVD